MRSIIYLSRGLFLLIATFFGPSLKAQYAMLDTSLSSKSVEQRLALAGQFLDYFAGIDSLDFRRHELLRYYEAAESAGDSLLVCQALEQLAKLEAVMSDEQKYQLVDGNILSSHLHENLYLPENENYIYAYTAAAENSFLAEYLQFRSESGLLLEELPQVGIKNIYAALQILEDEHAQFTLEDVLARKDSFELNRSIYDFNPQLVHWVKLDLTGNEKGLDSCILFVENSLGYYSWANIEAYLVHEDGRIDRQVTGINSPADSKRYNRFNNTVQVVLESNERGSLYLRLEAAKGKRQATYISLQGTRQYEFKPSDLYAGTKDFPYTSQFTPFAGQRLDVQHVFQEEEMWATLPERVIENWHDLAHSFIYDLNVVPEEVYWLKFRLLGSPSFSGRHYFHISPYPFVGTDVFAFDRYDTYLLRGGELVNRQVTGGKVPIWQRPLNFWSNLIAVNLTAHDTLDVFVRMSGAHRAYDMPRMDVWHIDREDLLARQLGSGWFTSAFAGILLMQAIFFFLLFFTQGERTNFYFALLILGVLIGTTFVDDNYRNFVLFPAWRPWHIGLFFSGLFLTQFGFIQFAASYFNYSRQSFWVKYFIPVFLVLSFLVDVNAIWNFEYLTPAYYPVNKAYHILAILVLLFSLVFSFLLGLLAKGVDKDIKRIFILAFSPGMLFILVLMARSLLGASPATIHLIDYIPNLIVSYDALRVGLLIMILLFALSIGFRTNLLKRDRRLALEEKLSAQASYINQLQRTDQLQELADLVNRFYTNITHEFRTPLTVIQGMSDQIMGHDKERSLIRRNSQRLLKLINQMLDLSKLESNELSLQLVKADIIPYLRYLTESFHSLAEVKEIELVFQTDLQEYIMDFDEEKIQQIIYNLFSNALKFTEAGGTVFFRVKEKIKAGKPRLELQIQDTGMGISTDALPHIFDRFYQADVNLHSNQREGTGIGLALTKELIQLMGGTIRVKSELKKGTTFTVLIPTVSQPHTPIKTSESFDPEVAAFKAVMDLPSVKQEPIKDKTNTDQPLVLVVEDNTDVTTYIESILKDQYQIRSAADGQQGIDMALALVPDLIITDVMMPKKDGFELCEVLKTDERTSHIPIVMLTAKATQEDRLAGLKTGADAYLMKPFDKEELLVRLEKLIALRQALQKQYAKAIPSFLGKLSSPSDKANDTTSLDEQFLRKISQIVEEKIGDAELDIDYLCKAVHLSSTQLFRKMKALTGEPPMSFIRKIRLHKAKTLLQTTNLSIAEIAYDLGFTDPNYFSRAFNKEFGAPPSALRK